MAEPGPARRIEVLFETGVLPLQPIAFELDRAALWLGARQLVAQSRDLLLLPVDQMTRSSR